MEKIKLGVSSCLLGEKTRYDGAQKKDPYITATLGCYFTLIPVCPEVGSGMPVPREPMRLEGDVAAPRLLTKGTKIERTRELLAFCRKSIKELEGEGLSGFILKKNSPSCGISRVKVYDGAGRGRSGSGLYAAAVSRHFPLLPLVDEAGLQDPDVRGNFIERVFVYRRWQQILKGEQKVNGLVRFHTQHKLLIMAHSIKHYRMLGSLVAGNAEVPSVELFQSYGKGLMAAMGIQATVKKHCNVLQHIMGYFKKLITTAEKGELLHVISGYRDGALPLLVPITLLNHYAVRYDQPYLRQQLYLAPDPVEQMLLNHA
jgi:uncharacterized protein YbgA (DUF1722 family)/uncharacterized protein YbbK (DUF523 family)